MTTVTDTLNASRRRNRDLATSNRKLRREVVQLRRKEQNNLKRITGMQEIIMEKDATIYCLGKRLEQFVPVDKPLKVA